MQGRVEREPANTQLFVQISTLPQLLESSAHLVPTSRKNKRKGSACKQMFLSNPVDKNMKDSCVDQSLDEMTQFLMAYMQHQC